jgi:putative glutamine amidotransferase
MMKEAKPLIGVVADVNHKPKHPVHSVGEKYIDAVTGGAGGLALLLPALIDRPGAAFTDPADIEQVLDLVDGIFLTGATSNVNPAAYGAVLADPGSPADPARDHVTLTLIRGAARRGVPLLGVCRGFQEINVALGGTLHQAVHEVPGMADHRERDEDPIPVQYGPAHAVMLTPGGLLHRLQGGAEAAVNSVHGQGVARLAEGLIVEAVAPDGLVEAFRGAGPGFLIAVQWHPEWMFRENALSLALFRAFGEAARAWRQAGHRNATRSDTLAA